MSSQTSHSTHVAEVDTRYIELDRTGELEFWCKVFDTTPEELHAAIAEVGPYAGVVALHLKGAAAAKGSR